MTLKNNLNKKFIEYGRQYQHNIPNGEFVIGFDAEIENQINKDVKGAVVEFEKFVFKNYGKKFEISAFEFAIIMSKYNEIFGDFRDETKRYQK